MKNSVLLFSKESRGGAGVFLKQMHMSNKQQYKIFLYKKDPLSSLKDSEVHYIIEKYPSDEKPSLYKVWLFLKSIWRSYHSIMLEKPKNILACDRYASIVILFLKFFKFIKAIPIYILINNNVPELDKRKPNVLYRYLLQASNKILYRQADKIIITSKEIIHYLKNDIQYDISKCIHIPHAVDLSQINRRISPNNKAFIQMKKDKRFKIISVGRLDEQKDFSTILYAFHRALGNTRGNEMSLYIVGEGNEKAELQRLTKKLNIGKHVYFLGWQKQVFPFLGLADIFVFSSFHEGFGTVLVEAMAAGLPIIATDTPYGPSEILENGKYGVLISMKDSVKMAEKITLFFKSKKMRKIYMLKSLLRCKRYDVRTIIKKYKQLFKPL